MVGVKLFCEFGVDVVVVIGGGSVMDIGKVIVLCGLNGGELFDYVDGWFLYLNIVLVICILIILGIGLEVICFVVIMEVVIYWKMMFKYSILRFVLVIFDVELILSFFFLLWLWLVLMY